MSIWTTIAVAGLLTFAIRLSFIAVVGARTLPNTVRRGLRLVPAAILSAILVPDVLYRDGRVELSPANPRLLAALAAILVAWRTRNMLLTIATGMAALWLVQWWVD